MLLKNPFHRLRPGAYFAQIFPEPAISNLRHYDGTIRVQAAGLRKPLLLSGDFYRHPASRPESGQVPPAVPFFPRSEYRIYILGQEMGETGKGEFTLGFDFHGFHPWKNQWLNRRRLSATLAWTQPKPEGLKGYPDPGNYLHGPIYDEGRRKIGQMNLGWVARWLRRGKLEMEKVNAVPWPAPVPPPSQGADWATIFAGMDWEFDEDRDRSDVPESQPNGEWNLGELHAWLRRGAASPDLDWNWEYYLLAVRRIRHGATPYFGVVWDPNQFPDLRSVAAVAAAQPMRPEWFRGVPRRLHGSDGYLRTAIHEIGHAMNLDHNPASHGFMNETRMIGTDAAAQQRTFDEVMEWSFQENDARRLGHWPDVWVRPGTPKRGATASNREIEAALVSLPIRGDVSGIQFSLQPQSPSFPFGAPVRIGVELFNETSRPLDLPPTLDLKSGIFHGRVLGPSSEATQVQTIGVFHDETPLRRVKPGEGMSGSFALMRGISRPLFSQPGHYTLEFIAVWVVGGKSLVRQARATCVIEEPGDELHRQIAGKIHRTAEMGLKIEIGGLHLDQANQALERALQVPQLRDHFIFFQARDLARRFFETPGDIATALKLFTPDTIVTLGEIREVIAWIRDAWEAATKNPSELRFVVGLLIDSAQRLLEGPRTDHDLTRIELTRLLEDLVADLMEL